MIGAYIVGSDTIVVIDTIVGDAYIEVMPQTSRKWNISDIPDQSGRTAVVTGANSGIGLAAADALAHAGGHVVLAVRDVRRGEAAAATVRGAKGSVEVRRLDLADLSSVREFAAGWQGTSICWSTTPVS